MNRPRLAHTRATLTASVVSFVACASPPPRAAEPPAATPAATPRSATPPPSRITPALTETRQPPPPDYDYVPAQPETLPGPGQQTYPNFVTPLIVISSDHRDCPADHPAPRIGEYVVSEGRLCLGWKHGQNMFDRWVFAPADPASEGPARRPRYRLCIEHLGSTSKPMFKAEVPSVAIAVKDFPGGEIPELVNLRLQNRPKDFPPYIPPLSCDSLAPTLRLAPGEPVPLVRNLAALEKVNTGWELGPGETFDMEGWHRPGDRRRR